MKINVRSLWAPGAILAIAAVLALSIGIPKAVASPVATSYTIGSLTVECGPPVKVVVPVTITTPVDLTFVVKNAAHAVVGSNFVSFAAGEPIRLSLAPATDGNYTLEVAQNGVVEKTLRFSVKCTTSASSSASATRSTSTSASASTTRSTSATTSTKATHGTSTSSVATTTRTDTDPATTTKEETKGASSTSSSAVAVVAVPGTGAPSTGDDNSIMDLVGPGVGAAAVLLALGIAILRRRVGAHEG